MEERDYFAAQAMQSIIAVASNNHPNYLRELSVDQNWSNLNNNFRRLAECSYKIADAMLAEKLKTKPA